MGRFLSAGGVLLKKKAAVLLSLLMGLGTALTRLTAAAHAGDMAPTVSKDTMTRDTMTQTQDTTTQTPTPGSTKPTLFDELSKGLKARRPEEFDFVRHVVHLVDDGHLPRSLVDSTFLWARGKPAHQIQYFEMGLKARAKQMGVSM